MAVKLQIAHAFSVGVAGAIALDQHMTDIELFATHGQQHPKMSTTLLKDAASGLAYMRVPACSKQGVAYAINFRQARAAQIVAARDMISSFIAKETTKETTTHDEL